MANLIITIFMPALPATEWIRTQTIRKSSQWRENGAELQKYYDRLAEATKTARRKTRIYSENRAHVQSRRRPPAVNGGAG